MEDTLSDSSDPNDMPLTDDELEESEPQRDHRFRICSGAGLSSSHLNTSNFSFPRLSLHGSVDEFAALDRDRPFYTPPAALSTLGIRERARMPQNGLNALVDEPYDMIDDLSEISNDDDHETASIGSNDQDHMSVSPIGESVDDLHGTPEISPHVDSVAEIEPLVLPSIHSDMSHTQPPAKADVETRAENELIDSYTSEDLDTPRQSTVPAVFQSTWRQAVHRNSIGAVAADGPAHKIETLPSKILFVSDSSASYTDLKAICCQAAAGLDPEVNSAADLTPIRLPGTPSESQLANTTVIYHKDKLSATVKHCTDARNQPDGIDELHITNASESERSVIKIDRTQGLASETIDLAVFFLEEHRTHSDDWMKVAYVAVTSLQIPALFIADDANTAYSTIVQLDPKGRGRIDRNHIAISTGSCSSVAEIVRSLIHKQRQSSMKKALSLSAELKKFKVAGLWLLLLSLIYIIPQISSMMISTSPAQINAARRDALQTELGRSFPSTETTNYFDIDHILPALPDGCVSTVIFGRELTSPACAMDVRYQVHKPNHVLVSLPGQRRFPRVGSVEVLRSAQTSLKANVTKMIDGVHLISLEPREAFGAVEITILTTGPRLNVSLAHNFGSRMLHRQTYQDVGMDVSKAMSKDVQVMKDAAKCITDKLTAEVDAGLRATKGVSTNLTRHLLLDLQDMVGWSYSGLKEAAKIGNETISAFSKDVADLQKGILNLSGDVVKSIRSTLRGTSNQTKFAIRETLLQARGRLSAVKENSSRHAQKPAQNEVHPAGDRSPSMRDTTQPSKEQINDLKGSTFGSQATFEALSRAAASSLEDARRKLNFMTQNLEALKASDKPDKKRLREMRSDIRKQAKEIKKLKSAAKRVAGRTAWKQVGESLRQYWHR